MSLFYNKNDYYFCMIGQRYLKYIINKKFSPAKEYFVCRARYVHVCAGVAYQMEIYDKRRNSTKGAGILKPIARISKETIKVYIYEIVKALSLSLEQDEKKKWRIIHKFNGIYKEIT